MAAASGHGAAPATTEQACSGPLPEVLRRIREPQLRLAVWQRRLPPALGAWLAEAFRPATGSCRLTLHAAADDADALARALAAQAGLRAPPPLALRWQRDVLDLARLARRIAPQAGALRVRIERIDNDGCRLFHVDQVPLRLLCAYLGPGPQWLPEAAFERAGLGCGCNGHVRDWSAVREVANGHVAVMKGACHPGPPGGLVHRSPPATPAAPRVLLTIDFG